MTYTLEELNKRMERNAGSLYLEGCTSLTSLPEGLTVGGWLDLSGCTSLTSLPDGLTVGGGLYLSGCTSLTSLPDGLTVGGWLNLRDCTSLTSLPDGLTVGGWLNLSGCTSLTSLPEGLTVGGWLYLSGCTSLTSLPEGLTVGGWLDLSGCTISNPEDCKNLKDGDYVPGRYLYCDGILTHVKRCHKFGDSAYYVGKIKGKNVIFDGENYAHCKSFKEGVADLEFKKAKDRGTEQYRSYNLDTSLNPDAAMTMYRIITGACRQGTESFVNSLGKLKKKYTVREIISLTEGQYRADVFRRFFEEGI